MKATKWEVSRAEANASSRGRTRARCLIGPTDGPSVAEVRVGVEGWERNARLLASAPELRNLLALAEEDPAALGLRRASPWMEAVRDVLARIDPPETKECPTCLGYGHIDHNRNRPSLDGRFPNCGVCLGTGTVPLEES